MLLFLTLASLSGASDQVDQLFDHQAAEISTINLYHGFVTGLHQQQREYAKHCRKMCEDYLNRNKKHNLATSFNATYELFIDMFKQSSLALTKDAKGPLSVLIEKFKALHEKADKEYKENKNRYEKLKSDLEKSRSTLDSVWRTCADSFKIYQTRTKKFQTTEKSMQSTKADILKAKGLQDAAYDDYQKSYKQYCQQHEKYKTSETQFHQKDLPELITALELKTEANESECQQLLQHLLNTKLTVEQSVCDKLRTVPINIVPYDDRKVLIAAFKSKYYPPVPPPLLDLNACPKELLVDKPNKLGAYMLQLPPESVQLQKVPSSAVWNRTAFVCDIGKRSLQLDEMTGQQIQHLYDGYYSQLKSLENELGGVERLHEAYRKDPSMGSVQDTGPKIDAFKRRISSLTGQLQELQAALSNAPAPTTSMPNRPVSVLSTTPSTTSDYHSPSSLRGINKQPTPPPTATSNNSDIQWVSDDSFDED